MTDNQLRGLVLQKYYNRRREGLFQWKSEDFQDVPEDFDGVDLFRVCDQLGEHNLIEWKSAQGPRGETIGGFGRISAFGVDVVEGHAKPPISITLHQSRHISVHSSSNVQIGNANVQDVSIEIEKVIAAIDSSPASESEKTEAKSLLKKFLEHPLVTSIAGGLAGNLRLS